jgi:hypothetical protein
MAVVWFHLLVRRSFESYPGIFLIDYFIFFCFLAVQTPLGLLKPFLKEQRQPFYRDVAVANMLSEEEIDDYLLPDPSLGARAFVQKQQQIFAAVIRYNGIFEETEEQKFFIRNARARILSEFPLSIAMLLDSFQQLSPTVGDRVFFKKETRNGANWSAEGTVCLAFFMVF